MLPVKSVYTISGPRSIVIFSFFFPCSTITFGYKYREKKKECESTIEKKKTSNLYHYLCMRASIFFSIITVENYDNAKEQKKRKEEKNALVFSLLDVRRQ